MTRNEHLTFEIDRKGANVEHTGQTRPEHPTLSLAVDPKIVHRFDQQTAEMSEFGVAKSDRGHQLKRTLFAKRRRKGSAEICAVTVQNDGRKVLRSHGRTPRDAVFCVTIIQICEV